MLRGQHARGGPKLPHGRAAVATNKYSGFAAPRDLKWTGQFRPTPPIPLCAHAGHLARFRASPKPDTLKATAGPGFAQHTSPESRLTADAQVPGCTFALFNPSEPAASAFDHLKTASGYRCLERTG